MIAAHQIVRHLLEDEETDGADWKEVTAPAFADRLVALGFRQSDLNPNLWSKAAFKEFLGGYERTLGNISVWKRGQGLWDINVWYMGTRIENVIGLEDDQVLPYLQSLHRTRGMERIGEAVATLTLNQWLQDNEPEQWVLDNEIQGPGMDTPLPVSEVDPATLLCHETPLPKAARVAQRPPHSRIVKAYMKEPGGPILLNGNRILDGHHRAMAAYLAKRHVAAINLTDL